MSIESVQRCLQSGEDCVVEIASHSDPDVVYAVEVFDFEDPEEIICECEGFVYRGYCSHQQEAVDALCRWHELDGPEEQTPEQRRAKICPRCGNETEWIMEVVDA